jgi:hypothetical protein
MTELSPAAQAVLDAMYEVNMDFDGENATLAAAALQAAAEQLAYGHGSWAGTSAIIDEDKLLAIAAELKAHD